MRSTTPRLLALLATVGIASVGGAGCSSCKNDSSSSSATDSGPAAAATPSSGASAAARPSASAAIFTKHQLPNPSHGIAGFAPSTNGFSFQNYGNSKSYTNLTSLELRRMFGDQVCGSLEGDKCSLTPQATEWVKHMNQGMGGGHCEGFAALSLLMQRGQIAPALFGAAHPFELKIDDNIPLQREIAYWFVTQAVLPMAAAERKDLTPNEVVDKLRATLKTGEGAESYTIGIYEPGYKSGHATTPYAIVDKGEGVVWILHYDNNYPGVEKHIEVNTAANTWAYTTASDPEAEASAYNGDAKTKTLTIAPSSIRTGPLVCSFCGDIDGDDAAEKGHGPKGSLAMREIMLDGDGDLLISDENGKRLGYVEGELVSEIPGATFAPEKSGASEDEPFYFVPASGKLKVTLDGSRLKKDSKSDIALVGPGYTLGVENITLHAGQKDLLEFSADWSEIRYTTKQTETPTLVLGIETKGADYLFEVKVSGETAGQTANLSIDTAKGTFKLKVHGSKAGATYTVDMVKTEKGGDQKFTHHGSAVGDDQIATFDYGAWKGNKTPLHVTVTDSKGAVISQDDQNDEE